MKRDYATFRLAIKAKLLEEGYPVEISKFYANGRIRCLGRDIISKNGIRIERERISEYRPSLRIEKYNEWIRIYTNGYIDRDTIKKFVTEAFEKYTLKYGIIKLRVIVVDNKEYKDGDTILRLEKDKNFKYEDLSEYDKMKIARSC